MTDSLAAESFQGFHRPDGRVGVRNHLLVLSVTGLTGPTARRIARNIVGAKVVTMPYGSGLAGADAALHRRALIGLVRNANVGAVVVVGGNPPVVEAVAEAAEAAGTPAAALAFDDCGHDALTLTDRGLRAGAMLARDLSRQRRRTAPASALFFGMECGRSDPSSGLVSNPLVGKMSDRVVDAGGRAVVGETMEWMGAEHLLAARAASPAVAEAVTRAVARREQAAVDAGIDLVGDNPGVANIRAGLSSIEEKSLGAVAKTGSRPVQGVIGIAEPPGGPGLWLMDAPAYAPESVTGFTTAGATMVFFTTGVGNSYVSQISPTVKVSGNPESARRLGQQIDFDASAVFEGRETPEAAAERFWSLALEVAGGTLTWGEILDEGEEVISRLGAAL